MSRNARSLRALLRATAVIVAAAGAASAQDIITYSTDVSVVLEGVLIEDETAAQDDLAGTVTADALGIPPPADLRALERLPGGAVWFALDTAATVAGGIRVEPRDVVRWSGSVATVAFDGGAAGVADGVRVDAVALAPEGLLLSFDQTVRLGLAIADDEDLVLFDGTKFGHYFDGTAFGFAAALDLDGASLDRDGDLVLSFDQAGSVGGVVFDDEDLVLVPLPGGAPSLLVDGSLLHNGAPLALADVDAVALPPPVLFADDFESGDLSGWSGSTGG